MKPLEQGFIHLVYAACMGSLLLAACLGGFGEYPKQYNAVFGIMILFKFIAIINHVVLILTKKKIRYEAFLLFDLFFNAGKFAFVLTCFMKCLTDHESPTKGYHATLFLWIVMLVANALRISQILDEVDDFSAIFFSLSYRSRETAPRRSERLVSRKAQKSEESSK